MCYICGCSGQLLACVLCTHVYHSQCIALPLPSIPQSPLQCPQCQVRVLIQWLDILPMSSMSGTCLNTVVRHTANVLNVRYVS